MSRPKGSLNKRPKYINVVCPHCKLEQQLSERCRSCKGSFIAPLREVIRKQILYAYKICGFDATLAAKMLGISRTTMYRYLEEYERNRDHVDHGVTHQFHRKNSKDIGKTI